MIEKKPFIRYKLDEELEDETGETFTVRLNQKERAWLDELKRDLDIKSDGKALKLAGLIIGRNVLHSIFSPRLLRYLFKKERVRLSDYEDISSQA